jgi:MFS family permease
MASLGIALGVAPGMTALVMATTIATRWFTARRGLVLGILGAGNATGQLIFLMPAAWIARTYGWRMALVPPMLAIMVLALLAALLAVDRPADLSDLLRARAQNVCRLASGGANGPRDRSHELGRTIQSFGERLHGGAERVSRGRHHPALTSGRGSCRYLG